MKKLKWKKDFGGGVRATVTMDSVYHAGSQPPERVVKWNVPVNDLTTAIFRPYVDWMNEINQRVSNHWNVKMAQVYMMDGMTCEAWAFEPGKAPRLIQRGFDSSSN